MQVTGSIYGEIWLSQILCIFSFAKLQGKMGKQQLQAHR